MSEMTDRPNRQSGLRKNEGDFWLVLTESVQQSNGKWVHICKTQLKLATANQYHGEIPYCPNCEVKPS
jgi:hypothetical protein